MLYIFLSQNFFFYYYFFLICRVVSWNICTAFPRHLRRLYYFYEKCLVVHSHLTPIPPLPTWTNNIVKKNGSHYTLSIISYIIGSSKQEWDRSGMRVYNQAFLFHIFLIYFTVIICSSFCGTIKIYIWVQIEVEFCEEYWCSVFS
jgi:hypothetical protein